MVDGQRAKQATRQKLTTESLLCSMEHMVNHSLLLKLANPTGDELGRFIILVKSLFFIFSKLARKYDLNLKSSTNYLNYSSLNQS